MSTESSGSLTLDLHGVTASVRSPVRHQLERLRRDFGSATPRSRPELRVEVLPSATEALGPKPILGILGSMISSDDGGRRVLIAGPSIADPSSYLAEVRPYFAAYLFDRLVEKRKVQKLHASAVAWQEGATVFAGEKLSGKTTMALIAAAAGARYMANDVCFLELAGEAVTTLGVPQDLTVGAETRSWLAREAPQLVEPEINATVPRSTAQPDVALATEKRTISIDSLEGIAAVQRDAAPLAAIVFPEPALSLAAPRARRLDPREAIVRLAATAEGTPKWGFPPTLAGDRYLTRMTSIVSASVSRAACWHLQWCRNHEANLALLCELRPRSAA